MIRPSELIEYIREHRTNGETSTWRVDYAVNYAIATNKSQLDLPCFYVEMNSTTATIESDNDFLQLFRTNIRIRLVCKSQMDRMGRTGAEVAYQARLELFKILLFKKLKPTYNEIYFVGDGFEGIDEARYIHTFDFMFTGKMDPSWLESEEFIDLRSIYVDYDLVESDPSEKPNAQDIINVFQDDL